MMKMTATRWIALLLAIVMVMGVLPMEVFAEDYSAYYALVEKLETLETYAGNYAAANGGDTNELVLNYLRTRVDRYKDDNWNTLAGSEITAFTSYVAAQDEANGTSVGDLDNMLESEAYEIVLPNGNSVDFGHMFGAMNIAYVAAEATGDLGGWAGDICDLLNYSYYHGDVPSGSVEEMTAYILGNCFGVDADDAFGMDDFYGDMDAYYLCNQMQAGKQLTTVMKSYFTADLTDADRAAYFMNNRFSGLETNEDVRSAVYNAYTTNVGLKVLEAKRGLTDCNDLRTAACYAFADYLFELAGDRLEGDGGNGDGAADSSYTIFSTSDSVLAPGITQSINYALNSNNQQFVYYLATVDITRDDIAIFANYKNNDPSDGWGMQRLTEQMAAAEDNHTHIENYTAVVGINADFYNMSNGKPSGALVMEGEVYNEASGKNFFAILDDGSAVIGTAAEWATYKDRVQEAVGGSVIMIQDGKAVDVGGSYYTTSGCRSVVGITADGKVLMMVVDGRQAPFSVGATVEETVQILLEAGCVTALHLDGGGSATYAAKSEGSDAAALISRPSDGYERSVSSTLIAVSTAKSSNEFDHASISSDYDYLTVDTSLTMSAIGVSNTGNSAAIPENAQWQVSDPVVGTVSADGVFTALAKGEVEVQLAVEGVVVGTKVLYVVDPDALAFEKDKITVVYGVPTELPLLATYKGNPVAFNWNDVYVGLEDESAGTLDYLTFVGDEESGVRNVLAAAFLMADEEVYSVITINMFSEGEAYFDFEKATAGNYTFAWLRKVSNAISKDDMLHQIVNIDEDMVIDYTFALDMSQIEIPPALEELTYMLPGADAGSTAWDFLLQLAERISVLSQVTVKIQLDQDLNVDISELKIVNEYFYLQSAALDENNLITIVCGWIDQTAAVDPATANPTCIVSGLRATPKDDVSWDAADQAIISNTGTVSYNIYLRANALYNFAMIEENQIKYSLVPFVNEDVIINGDYEKGASFGSEYATFEDVFILDVSNRQGWVEEDDKLFYFVNNEAVTGLQYLPGYEDSSVNCYYMFGEDGVCLGAVTGKILKNGNVYYAAKGILQKGWQSIMEENGESYFYYFDPYTYAAVGAGEGWITVEGYQYLFVDHKCMKGSLVETSGGLKYRFAGLWQRNQWIEMDGNWYFIAGDYYAVKGGFHWIRAIDGTEGLCHLFDENGVWQQDVYGPYDIGSDTYWIENGIRIQEAGLIYYGGYYYYFASNAKAVKNRTYWPTKTNGLLPVGPYNFDEYGHITNVPGSAPVEPETPENPEEVKNGIVHENGGYYYYVDGVLQCGAGLILVGEDYYYIRSNGQAAVGNYWITNHNNLLPMGMYTFGSDGKMITDDQGTDDSTEPDVPVEVKNGIVEEAGVLCYYIDGVRAYGAGVLKLTDEDGVSFYIYVRSNAQLATGIYWPTITNGLLNVQAYNWGADGRYYPSTQDDTQEPTEPEIPEVPAVKNGIVEENGTLYYYVDGTCAYGAGVVKLTDENGAEFYIYVRSNGQLATGVYWPTTTNGMLTYGKSYDFGTDGRLYL